MVSKDRIPKTLNRKLSDLEDHLYFLKESLFKISNGDDAYLKTLAVELRVLLCKASGTEGLLWRIIDEMHLRDAVHVHLPENLNRDHSLARGLDFLFVPIFRAGEGDPRLSPKHYSLKRIIKEKEAVIVSGNAYTHEKLIRAVAEQMGSAHEDDSVEPHLIELGRTVITDQSALNLVLISDAKLALEVGERILFEAEQQTIGFIKRNRPVIVVPDEPVRKNTGLHNADFGSNENQLPNEGTALGLVNHLDTDWITNSQCYDFGLFKQGALSIRAVKHSDKTMEVHVEGLAKNILSIRKPIPAIEQPGVMVGVAWSAGEVIFFLNGERVDVLCYENKC